MNTRVLYLTNKKVSTAKDHDKNHIKNRPPLVRHLLRNCLLKCDKALWAKLGNVLSDLVLDPFLFCLAQLITIMQNNNLFNILASHNLVKYFLVYYDKSVK